MIWAILFLLYIIITGLRRKQRIRNALNNPITYKLNYRNYDKFKEQSLKQFYDNNLQKNKYV